MTKLKLTTHTKRRGAIEVRAFVWLQTPSQWHRIGTWCLPRVLWEHTVRRVLVQGAEAVAVPLAIDDSHSHALGQ